MNRTDYKNQHIREHYDRQSLTLPKGMKDRIRKLASQNNTSVNDYITRLIERDTDEYGNSRLANATRFGEPEKRILQKWQISVKFHGMIEAISEQDGCFILLKQGFTNDVTGSRMIQASSINQIRTMVTKSHPIREGRTPGTDEEMIETLRKWQIGQKYFPMIESVTASRKDGNTITLKEGFINDQTGSRVIHAAKAKAFKSLLKYSHPI